MQANTARLLAELRAKMRHNVCPFLENQVQKVTFTLFYEKHEKEMANYICCNCSYFVFIC